jgi:hypothetical protein
MVTVSKRKAAFTHLSRTLVFLDCYDLRSYAANAIARIALQNMLRSSSLVLSKRYRSRCSTRQEALCRLSKTCLCLNVSKFVYRIWRAGCAVLNLVPLSLIERGVYIMYPLKATKFSTRMADMCVWGGGWWHQEPSRFCGNCCCYRHIGGQTAKHFKDSCPPADVFLSPRHVSVCHVKVDRTRLLV